LISLINKLEELRTFGVSVATTGAPMFLDMAVALLKKKNAKLQEGIFRVSGNNAFITEQKEKINRGEFDFAQLDVHSTAGLLKAWVREQPDPLIPLLQQEELSALELAASEAEAVSAVRVILSSLPPGRRTVLETLLLFFHEVAQHAPVNKMDARNISVVFAPHFMKQEEDSINLSAAGFKTFAFLIENALKIFNEAHRKVRYVELITEEEEEEKATDAVKDESSLFFFFIFSSFFLITELLSKSTGMGLSLSDIVKTGKMSKKGIQRTSWKERWFVLKIGFLYYFKSQKVYFLPSFLPSFLHSFIHLFIYLIIYLKK
jgi:hypothetical protein